MVEINLREHDKGEKIEALTFPDDVVGEPHYESEDDKCAQMINLEERSEHQSVQHVTQVRWKQGYDNTIEVNIIKHD